MLRADNDKMPVVVSQHILMDISRHRACIKRCLQLSLVLMTVVALFLLYLLYILNRGRWQSVKHFTLEQLVGDLTNEEVNTGNNSAENMWFSIMGRHNTYGFHPVNDKGIFSYWNVCIEASYPPVQRSIEYLGKSIYFNETQKIVVYNSFFRNGMQKVYTSGSHNSGWNHWDVHFSRSPIPKSHRFNTNTVYFVSETCPANFHHFWIDEFVPLYTVVKQANKLRPNANNQILFRRPTGLLDAETRSCSNRSVFEAMLATLYTTPLHDVFYHAEPNTCYSSGVFGTTPINLSRPRDVVDHVLKELGIKSRKLSEAEYVTFIQRTNRLIGNVDELVTVAQSLGFNKVRVVTLEGMSVRKQAEIATQSRIMIGVQGAGLQWAVFMPAGSTLVEIAWPYKHWGFYFGMYVTQYGIHYETLGAQYVHLNWTSYETFVRGGVRVNIDERLELMQKPPKSGSVDNIWKWADGWVNKDHFLQKMITLDMQHNSFQETVPIAGVSHNSEKTDVDLLKQKSQNMDSENSMKIDESFKQNSDKKYAGSIEQNSMKANANYFKPLDSVRDLDH